MSRLLKATFECEVITPMFLAGADQKKPEIRAASVRGQLRCWFRAIYGGMNGGNEKDCLEKETALFGGTTGDEAGQSKVWIKVNSKFHHSKKEKVKPVPHKNFQFDAVPQNTRFTILMSAKSGDESSLNCVISLLKLSSILGGIGRRSRRGFGSYQIFSDKYDDHSKVEKAVRDAIRKAKQQVKKITGVENELIPQEDISPWPIISNNHFKVRIAEPKIWDKFIEKLMNKLSDGLSSSHPDPNIYPEVLGDAEDGRQGSTLLVSVVKISDGKVVPVFSQFFCQTKGHPTRSDFKNLCSFPVRIFQAQEIEL